MTQLIPEVEVEITLYRLKKGKKHCGSCYPAFEMLKSKGTKRVTRYFFTNSLSVMFHALI